MLRRVVAKARQKVDEVCRKRVLYVEHSGGGMPYAQALRMQKGARQAEVACEPLVDATLSMGAITDHLVGTRIKVASDLMSAPAEY